MSAAAAPQGQSAAFLAALLATALPVCSRADCTLERYAELPVTMADTRPLIQGSINGVALTFLADSGAFFNLLSPDSARQLQLKLQPLPFGFYVSGLHGDVSASVANVKDFSLVGFGGNGIVHDVKFVVAGAGTALGTGVGGVIGQNLIGHADTEFDLANGVIRLMHTQGCGDQPLAYWHGTTPVAVIAIHEQTPREPHLVGSALLNGARIGVLFDTGAMRSILDLRAARRAGIKLDGAEVLAGGETRGLDGHAVETWITRFDSLDLGGELIKNARLRIGDVAPPPGADMVLGADFFLSHRVYVASSQHKIYFTYNGGHVFDLSASSAATAPNAAPSAPAQGPPSAAATAAPDLDAAALQRRGAASAARRDYSSALADFDQAIQLEPDNPEIYVRRGEVRLQNQAMPLAAEDFDRALQLRPDYVSALLARGALRLHSGDRDGARVDFARIEQLRADDAALSLHIAALYLQAGDAAEASARFDRWVLAYPKDERLQDVLEARCRARALLGAPLDVALAACNAAVKPFHHDAETFESRAIVWLRLGDNDKSMADFKSSLSLQPKRPEARYGLGLNELRKGMRDAAARDMQAALAAKASVADEFKRLGLAP